MRPPVTLGKRETTDRGYKFPVEGTNRMVALVYADVDAYDVILEKPGPDQSMDCRRLGPIARRGKMWLPTGLKGVQIETRSMREAAWLVG